MSAETSANQREVSRDCMRKKKREKVCGECGDNVLEKYCASCGSALDETAVWCSCQMEVHACSRDCAAEYLFVEADVVEENSGRGL